MSDVMKAQYQVLSELKRIDEKVLRLQIDLEKIPLEIGKLNSALSTRKQEYDSAKKLVDDCEKKLRKAEQDLREKEDKLKKAEDKMMEVKTNQEYQAAMKENEGQKGEKAGLEEQVLKLINELEEQKKGLKGVETGFKEYEKTILDDVSKLETERSRVLKLLEEHIGVRNGISSQLASDIGAVYQRISQKMKGAVGYVENGSCVGCNMKMRPQLYNEILGFKAIHRCPSCGRILIIAQTEGGAGDAQSA